MALLPLVYYPAPILKTRCAEITEIDDAIVTLGRDMTETMYHSQGIGLAAPQVGHGLRLMTVDVFPDGKNCLHQLINPVIISSRGRTTYEEGCLSFPGITAEVKRRDVIQVHAYDLQGDEVEFEADGLLAICIQHEMDHLNGVTFVDRLNPVQRKLVLRDYLRLREDDEEQAALEHVRAVHS